MRAITAEGFKRPNDRPVPGAAPMLQWLAISSLVVDDTYQRPIRGEGERNVAKIAANFRWARFAPVVVAPVEGGMFAIIDGQHRTTAAALVGIETVPCQVVIPPASEQADAFKAINGSTTRMNRQTIHRAAVAAGDPEALAIGDACRCAGVEVLAYPVPTAKQAPGQTMSVATLAECLNLYGRDTLVTALQCVTETSNGEEPGLLVAPVIKALYDVLHYRKDWRDAGEALLGAFDEIDIAGQAEAARLEPKAKGISTAMVLTARLNDRLNRVPALTRKAA
ncbi:ParB N-terminal domain-containing protein [Methylobacterium sp. NPDC080182]|uniref:ParB N-terminal domain-containing protein n=1 Tax=Methylobacterium sp. NPDC080182 TaxID=3390590 RepID=UPI003D00D588